MTTRKIENAGHRYTVLGQEDICDSVTGRALTGSWLWNSSLAPSEWLATEAHLHLFPLTGKNVIERGTGSASLPGHMAVRLGASLVVLTDVAPILPRLRRNMEANGASERVEVRESGKTLRGSCRERTRVWAASEVRDWTGFWLEELGKDGFGAVELAFQLSGSGDEGHLVGEGRYAVYEISRTAQSEQAERPWLRVQLGSLRRLLSSYLCCCNTYKLFSSGG